MEDDVRDDIAQRYKAKENLTHHLKRGVFFLVLSWLIWFGFPEIYAFTFIISGYDDYEGGWLYYNLMTCVVITGFLGGINLGRGMLNIWEDIGIYNSKEMSIKENQNQIVWRVIVAVIFVIIAWSNRDLNSSSLSDEYVFMLFSAIVIGLTVDEFIEEIA